MPSWHAPEHLAYYCKGEPGSIGGTGIHDVTGFETWHGKEKLQPTQPPSSWVLGVKQPWHKADCSPLFVLRLRMIGGIPSFPHLAFMASMETNLPLLYLV